MKKGILCILMVFAMSIGNHAQIPIGGGGIGTINTGEGSGSGSNSGICSASKRMFRWAGENNARVSLYATATHVWGQTYVVEDNLILSNVCVEGNPDFNYFNAAPINPLCSSPYSLVNYHYHIYCENNNGLFGQLIFTANTVQTSWYFSGTCPC